MLSAICDRQKSARFCSVARAKVTSTRTETRTTSAHTHRQRKREKKKKETRANLSSCPSNRCHMLVFLLSQINKVFAFGFMCTIVDSNLRFAIEVFKLSIYLQLILCTTADAEVIVFKSNLHLGGVGSHATLFMPIRWRW